MPMPAYGLMLNLLRLESHRKTQLAIETSNSES